MRLNNMTWKEMALSHHRTGRTEGNLVILGHVGWCSRQGSKRAPLKHGSEEISFPQTCSVLVCGTYSVVSIRIQRYTYNCTIITGFQETTWLKLNNTTRANSHRFKANTFFQAQTFSQSPYTWKLFPSCAGYSASTSSSGTRYEEKTVDKNVAVHVQHTLHHTALTCGNGERPWRKPG
jgi:hypothetical protein